MAQKYRLPMTDTQEPRGRVDRDITSARTATGSESMPAGRGMGATPPPDDVVNDTLSKIAPWKFEPAAKTENVA